MPTVEIHEDGRGYDYVPTLNKEGAKRIGSYAVRIAEEIGISGITIVRTRARQLLYSELAGDTERAMFEHVADAKLITVLNFFRSSSIQRIMAEKGHLVHADFAGTMGSLLSGGVAIFADDERKLFLGGGAFSGADQRVDQAIMNDAIQSAGFFTDLEDIPHARLMQMQVTEESFR